MLSFWEQQHFLGADLVVVGGGIIGLSTAVHFKEKNPTACVIVLERGVFPSGASTKNVGFLSVSTLSEILADIQTLGEAKALDVIAWRKAGIEKLRSRFGDEALAHEPFGGYELFLEKDLGLLDELTAVNQKLKPLFGADVFYLRPHLLDSFGFNRMVAKALVQNPFDAQVDTGKVMLAWLELAGRLGIRILTGAQVTSIQDGVEVQSQDGSEKIHFSAKRVAVCTNAFLPQLFPALKISPGRGQVFITEPVATLPWRGTFNFDQGYYYFRNVGNRVIVGGGRHTDRETETSHAFTLNPGIHERLEALLRDLILPKESPKIEQRWTGIMGFSANHLPVIERISDSVVVGFGCNSMGLAMGTLIGEKTSLLFAE